MTWNMGKHFKGGIGMFAYDDENDKADALAFGPLQAPLLCRLHKHSRKNRLRRRIPSGRSSRRKPSHRRRAVQLVAGGMIKKLHIL